MLPVPSEPKVAVIRTSDRSSFRSCRRKWNWTSGNRGNLEPLQKQMPLWFGTGCHFAMEDRYGWNQYDRASDAFKDFVQASHKTYNKYLPDQWEQEAAMGVKILDYYEDVWTKGRPELKTFEFEGVPQVEVNFILNVPFDLKSRGWDRWWSKVIYAGTIDRVIEDEDGRLWLVDYKFLKKIESNFLLGDSQITTYCWAASHLYGRPIAGMLYQMHWKHEPTPPRTLKDGSISTAQNQVTSVPLYKAACTKVYGPYNNWPTEHKNYWAQLTQQESTRHDRFVHRVPVPVNDHMQAAEGTKILLELEDILNPNLPLYPNMTFMCKNMCSFYEACISLDDGGDWEQVIQDTTQQRSSRYDGWKQYLKNPKKHINLEGEI